MCAQKLEYSELFDIFKHCDEIHAKKESLYTPFSVAIVPAVILKWDTLNTIEVSIAGLVSLSLYIYFLLLIRRFGIIQRQIFQKLSAARSDFDEVMSCSSKYSTQRIRRFFILVLTICWVGLVCAKAIL